MRPLKITSNLSLGLFETPKSPKNQKLKTFQTRVVIFGKLVRLKDLLEKASESLSLKSLEISVSSLGSKDI